MTKVKHLRTVVAEVTAENLTLKRALSVKPHRRYSEEEKGVLLTTVERTQQQSGQSLSWILSDLRLSCSVYYDWLERCRKGTLADCVVIP